MAQDSDTGEKTEEPSQYRLEESRRKGEVASSKEVTNVLLLLATLMTTILAIVYMYETLSAFIKWLYQYSLDDAFKPEHQIIIAKNSIVVAIKTVGPLFIVSFCVGIISQIIQFGFVFAPDVLEMKFERVNPINGMKRFFSVKPLAETVKGLFKFAVVISITYMFLKNELPKFSGFFHVTTESALAFSKMYLAKIAFSILIGLAVIAILDFAWEKFQYKKKLMQTKQELKEENKEKEGSPEIKQRIKTVQREMSQKRMMADIPQADLIVTNPTHFSVAIKYDSQTMISPIVIAKGKDFLALKIREIAKTHDIPIVENIPLARTLYATVKIGDTVPRTLYKAVAEVIAFVYRLKRKNKVFA